MYQAPEQKSLPGALDERVPLSQNSCVTIKSDEPSVDDSASSKFGLTGPVKEAPIALPPTKRLAIVTCMDARINPFSQLGIKEGEAHIIRNAGAVAKDALRSLIISQRLLGTREIAIYHHTGCGIVTMTTPKLQQMIKDADPTNPDTAKQVEEIDFLEYGPDLNKSVKDDVLFLKNSPLILKDTKITGWIWDVDTKTATQVV